MTVGVVFSIKVNLTTPVASLMRHGVFPKHRDLVIAVHGAVSGGLEN